MVSRVSAAVASGGSSFKSSIVLGRTENCLYHCMCGIVVVRVAGRRLDADDLGLSVCSLLAKSLVLQRGPGCSVSSTAWLISQSFTSVGGGPVQPVHG